MRTIAVGEFKAKCLAVLAEVNASGQPVLVTKRGKPLARVVPSVGLSTKESAASILGCLKHMGRMTGDIVSSELSDDEWSRSFDEEWGRAAGKSVE